MFMATFPARAGGRGGQSVGGRLTRKRTGRMTTRRGLLALGLAAPLASRGSATVGPKFQFRLVSPDQRLAITIGPDGTGRPTYGVSFDRKPVLLPSPLGLMLGDGGVLSHGLQIVRFARSRADRRYTLVAGKTREARDHYNELRLDFEQSAAASGRRALRLTFRAYDDGIAFRYCIPGERGREAISLREELTRFDFPGDCTCWGLNLGKFGTGHEGEFRPVRAAAIRSTDLFDIPLVGMAGSAVFAIAEADPTGYAGLYLTGRGDGGFGVESRLSPRLDDPDIAVRGRPGAGLLSPWRVVMVADRPGRLIESTLITNLSPPSAIADTSWIKPGKYAWDWWSDDAVSGVAHPGMNDATMQRFIAFASELRLQYMLIDAGWYVTGQGGNGGPGADVTRSIPEIHLPALIAYGRQRNVSLWVWVHWKALDARMEEALELYQRLGLKGVKIDFMDRDDQAMVAWYHQVLRKAAQHRLMVDLHGACPPTGSRRTHPNLLTREAVMGAEYNKWSARVTATHNVTLAFTRMLLGPMDYTPGGFRNVSPRDFVIRYELPFVQTTRGQALAMYVVYESPFMSVADSPDAYKGQAGVDFLAAVPASWDETRVLAGEIGEFVAIARRSGKDWFVGAMTNEQARTVRIPFAFLGRGRFAATIYADGATPSLLAITRRIVGRGDTIDLRLASGGGGAISLHAGLVRSGARARSANT
jgi:alpha-glucosidase